MVGPRNVLSGGAAQGCPETPVLTLCPPRVHADEQQAVQQLPPGHPAGEPQALQQSPTGGEGAEPLPAADPPRGLRDPAPGD